MYDNILNSTREKIIRLVSGLFSLLVIAVLLICVVKGKGTSYACKKTFLPLIFTVPWVLVILWLLKRRRTLSFYLDDRRILLLLQTAFTTLQIVAIYFYYFETNWDVARLMELVNGEVQLDGHSSDVVRYFSSYPNNLFLGWVDVALFRFLRVFRRTYHFYYILLVLQSVLQGITGVLFFQLLLSFYKERKMAWIGYGLYLLTIGLSPWVSIPYSDGIVLVFPVLLLWICSSSVFSNKLGLRCFLFGFFCVIGTAIKPQICIVGVAVLLINAACFSRDGKQGIKRATKGIGAALLGIILGWLCVTHAVSSLTLPKDDEMSFSSTHFLMMGLNEQTNGVYSGKDVEVSRSVNTREERKRLNLSIAKNRVLEMGVKGLMDHTVKKALTNFNDGTFGWGNEGNFYKHIPDRGGSKLATLLRALYYSTERKTPYVLWSSIAQALWMSILFLSVFSYFGTNSIHEATVKLTLIGLMLFVMIFEARARYLYAFVPLFILTSVSGLFSLPSHFHFNKYKRNDMEKHDC